MEDAKTEQARMNLEEIIVVKFREFERRITDLIAGETQLACGQSCRPGCSDSCRAGGKTTIAAPTTGT